MYETILVLLDGSKRAEKIMPHVEGLANCLGSKLILLRVVEPVYYVMEPEVSYASINLDETNWQREEAEGYLEKMVKKMAQKGIEAEGCLEQGPTVEMILEAARKKNADLIAMASHGRTGLAQVFYGSTASGVLNRIDRPLLLIRAREDG